ncbi:MAG: hypothetical protein H0V18_08385 [Pyrinomonadaceae bacterium]|nr:hypothetical protein [Pyrinomonadaceae bacterium]
MCIHIVDCKNVRVVERAGRLRFLLEAAATVDYATADGTAAERSDYTTTLGTLRFAPGETAKSFDVLINEDSFVEGAESFTVNLSNPSGASLGAQPTTTVQITDDLSEPAANIIDDARTIRSALPRFSESPGRSLRP